MSDSRDSANPLPVAVVGCGRMGRFHARVYSEMAGVKLVGVCDTNAEVAKTVADEFACRSFATPEELLAALPVRACTIATPTAHHVDAAEFFLSRGVACLVEKPLARDVAEARRIVEASKRYKMPVQVGHIERFNPAIRAMNRLEMQPQFIEVTRISPLTFRSIDVGVVLDVMIHDIDIVLKLAQSAVAKIDAVGVSVVGESEDICNARITFENGCVANITASRLALKTERKLRVFSRDAYVSLDYQKRYGIVARRTGNVDAIRDVVSKIRAGEILDLTDLNYKDIVSVEELHINDADPLRAELESFVRCVIDGTKPEVSAEDGLRAVEVATQVVEAVGKKTI
jgi:predicted dehydrogenase